MLGEGQLLFCRGKAKTVTYISIMTNEETGVSPKLCPLHMMNHDDMCQKAAQVHSISITCTLGILAEAGNRFH